MEAVSPKFKSSKDVAEFHRQLGYSEKFCLAPFTTLLLEPDGKVGACRHKGSEFPVGNLLVDSFEDIWNGEFIKTWRKEFLEGRPQICKTEVKDRNCHQCPEYNSLLNRTDVSIHQLKKPLRLAFNFNGHCNLECNMCHIWQKPNGLYDEIKFWDRLDFWTENLEEVELLSGEPFVQKDTYKLIDLISQSKPNAEWTITTNANWVLTDYVKAELNKIKIKNIIVSIDSVVESTYAKIRKKGNLQKALKTLADLHDYEKWRVANGLSPLDIRVNFLIQKENWRELGIIHDFGKRFGYQVFRTFLYEPTELSLLNAPYDERLQMLEWYFENLTYEQLINSTRVVRPLTDSLNTIDKFYILDRYSDLIKKNKLRPSLGLGKTLFNSSVCVINENEEPTLILSERLLRKKASGVWPVEALKELQLCHDLTDAVIFENRDMADPLQVEKELNSRFPFFEHLRAQNLERFSRHFNADIRFATHHICHAGAATFMSPFEKALILVIDGAGSRLNSFSEGHPEFSLIDRNRPAENSAEERSVYAMENGTLTCVKKEFQTFVRSMNFSDHYFSEGLGTLYEKASEFIFNSKRSAGKVMGLAALGKSRTDITDSKDYLESLDWSRQFKGGTKADWQRSPDFSLYCDIAADVQSFFEKNYIGYIRRIKNEFPDFENLILAGGCALNCTANMKVQIAGLFKNIYVSPFPGDESIGLGSAFLARQSQKATWQPREFSKQHGYFGSPRSTPSDEQVARIFSDFQLETPRSIEKHVAGLLADGKVIAWFQGRSETGPRALGNRSILCRPDRPNAKDYLNEKIKFRESFRPYGSSVLFEKASEYFSVPDGFENPYMSFATEVREKFRPSLKEVTHIDGTSRMQTVRIEQNPRFYLLLKEFGDLTGLYCLLNTSLNIMGEPIVETLEDARNFLTNVAVDGIAVGNFFIRRK